jgi:hypothetical protein
MDGPQLIITRMDNKSQRGRGRGGAVGGRGGRGGGQSYSGPPAATVRRSERERTSVSFDDEATFSDDDDSDTAMQGDIDNAVGSKKTKISMAVSRVAYSRGTPTVLRPITDYECSTVKELLSEIFNLYGLAITKTIKVTNPVVEGDDSTYDLDEAPVSASNIEEYLEFRTNSAEVKGPLTMKKLSKATSVKIFVHGKDISSKAVYDKAMEHLKSTAAITGAAQVPQATPLTDRAGFPSQSALQDTASKLERMHGYRFGDVNQIAWMQLASYVHGVDIVNRKAAFEAGPTVEMMSDHTMFPPRDTAATTTLRNLTTSTSMTTGQIQHSIALLGGVISRTKYSLVNQQNHINSLSAVLHDVELNYEETEKSLQIYEHQLQSLVERLTLCNQFNASTRPSSIDRATSSALIRNTVNIDDDEHTPLPPVTDEHVRERVISAPSSALSLSQSPLPSLSSRPLLPVSAPTQDAFELIFGPRGALQN